MFEGTNDKGEGGRRVGAIVKVYEGWGMQYVKV
jgi:hypothetical protein